jgi:nicotinate-nucleotide adenylyltransferase
VSGGGPIALFGTSADPPTCGHRALLAGLLEVYPRVATWASDNPTKQHVAPLALRRQLLATLVEAFHDPRISLEQELSSPWAIDTLERAAQRWPQRELVFVVGSDLLGQIPRWRRAPELLAGCRLAIVPRSGWPLHPEALAGLQSLGARTEVLPLQIPASASSDLRRATDLSQLPAELRPVLLEHNLYGLPQP